MKPFKIRCSAIGILMTGKIGLSEKQESDYETFRIRHEKAEKPLTELQLKKFRELEERKFNPELPQTAKTFIETWLKERLYARYKFVSTKQMRKGIEVEDESIDFISEQLFGGSMLLKNEKKFSNDYMVGTPDVILPELVIDAKNSWDCFGFPLFSDDIPTDDYEWQGQGYMHLTGIKEFKLIYVLSDTPMHLIEQDARRYCWDNGYDPSDEDVLERFQKQMTYEGVDNKLKLKSFDFSYKPEKILQIEDRVKMAREYIEHLLSKFVR